MKEQKNMKFVGLCFDAVGDRTRDFSYRKSLLFWPSCAKLLCRCILFNAAPFNTDSKTTLFNQSNQLPRYIGIKPWAYCMILICHFRYQLSLQSSISAIAITPSYLKLINDLLNFWLYSYLIPIKSNINEALAGCTIFIYIYIYIYIHISCECCNN